MTTPCKAIKLFCLDCAGSKKARLDCTKKDCNLYPYRLGQNPARAGINTDKARLGGKIVSGGNFNHSSGQNKVSKSISETTVKIPDGWELKMVKKQSPGS